MPLRLAKDAAICALILRFSSRKRLLADLMGETAVQVALSQAFRIDATPNVNTS